MRYSFSIIICLLFLANLSQAQVLLKGEIYSLSKLSQEPITVTATPHAKTVKEVGDTTFWNYGDGTCDFKIYFVNGEKYDPVFNPNPTGAYINNQHFIFYCSNDMSFRQNTSNFLDIEEFTYLGRRYLVLVNYREDCAGDGCRYRCYNIFDITDGKKVVQYSFSSIYEGLASFGEFNNDGMIDFVRVAPKPPKVAQKIGERMDYYLITAYSLNGEEAIVLKNPDGHPNYIYAQGDNEVQNFQVLQADWFFSLRDTSGHSAPRTSYYPPYISFDPFYKRLYDADGVRIDKKRWSIMIREIGDVDGAKEFCQMLAQDKKVRDTYIMIDQYSGDIKFQILAGNFESKDRATSFLNTLKEKGVEGKLVDFREMY